MRSKAMRQITGFLLTAAIALAVSPASAASVDSIGVIHDTAMVVAMSDTLESDTSSYVVTATIPKGFVQSLQDAADGLSDSSFPGSLLSGGLGALLTTGGLLLALAAAALALLPFALIVLLVWLAVRLCLRIRQSSRRRYSEMSAYAEAAPAEPYARSFKSSGNNPGNANSAYAARRDKAIRNIAIGAGLSAFSAFLDFRFGMGVGALVTCWGIGGLVIARHYRDERNPQNHSG